MARLIREAAAAEQRVRVAGAGHSFAPVVPTEGMLLSLDEMCGVVSVDPARSQARIAAGTRLSALGEPLAEHGLALANQGDIDTQTVAGAIATGTHGTGLTLRSLSSMVAALRLVTATGEVVAASRGQNSDLFEAARLSVGALGVVTEITLDLVPKYSLVERTWEADADEALGRLDDLISEHRHFEFFWWPGRDVFEMKAIDRCDDAGPERPTSTADTLRSGPSYEIFPTDRDAFPFNEIEYSMPADRGKDCFFELCELKPHRRDLVWPVEYRTVGAEDVWLSPSHGRDSVTISVHQDAKRDHSELFAAAEAIFRNHGGRPHWGKLHTLTEADLEPLYPRWSDFQAVRARLDPDGRFSNAYTERAFGASSSLGDDRSPL